MSARARPRRLADRLARTLMLWVGGVWLLLSIRRSNREDREDDER